MSKIIRTVVLGVQAIDGGDQLAPGVELAESLGATLHLVHAYAVPETSLYTSLDINVMNPKVLEDLQQRVQQRMEERVRSRTDSGRVHCHARPGSAALAVLDVADIVKADLTIVGSTRSGMVVRSVLSSTAQRVIRNSKSPVLVSHRAGRDIRRVLLATDLSDLSVGVTDLGVRLAGEITSGSDAEWRAVMVVGFDRAMVMPAEPGGVARAAEKKLSGYVDRMRTHIGRAISGQVRVGEAAREILAEVIDWKADLLVIGTHGRGGALRFMIGSVAESVLGRVTCDVLVVPAAVVQPPSGEEKS